MDCRRNTMMILVTCIFSIVIGIGGQSEEVFLRLCDICVMDNLLDCNTTENIQTNITANCEPYGKVCALGMDQYVDDFENITLDDVKIEDFCILKIELLTKTMILPSFPMPILAEEIDGSEQHKAASEEMFVQFTTSVDTSEQRTPLTGTESTLGFQDLQATKNATSVLPTSVKPDENEEVVKSLDYQGDQPTDMIRLSRSDTVFAPTGNSMGATGALGKEAMPDYTVKSVETTNAWQSELEHATTEPPLDSTRTSQSDSITSSIESPDDWPVISCLKCDSSSQEACVSNANSLKSMKCPDSFGCVSYRQNGNLIRDCASSISSKDLELCNKPSNLSCDYCADDTCNDKPWKECFQCHSKDNPNCALWSKVEEIPRMLCPNHGGICLVRITTDGDTLRDCVPADFAPSDDGELSLTCNTHLCNDGVFPANRRRCILCEDCEAEQNASIALPCGLYRADDQCFLYVTENSKMKRGCVSDVEMRDCEYNAPKCITCGDTDGCNSAPLMKDAKLSCSKCKTKDEPSCAWAQPPASVKKCENKVLYYLQETCMIEFHPLKKDTVRDCSFDYGVCAPDDKNCRTCSGNGCNVGDVRDQQCIQCVSSKADEASCAASAEGILPTKCTEDHQTYERKGCFSMTTGNVTIRGCTIGLKEEEFKLCKTQGNTNCELCVEDGCNNKLAPSAGWIIRQTFPFVLVAVLFFTI